MPLNKEKRKCERKAYENNHRGTHTVLEIKAWNYRNGTYLLQIPLDFLSIYLLWQNQLLSTKTCIANERNKYQIRKTQ